MISGLLARAYSFDVELWVEADKLKYRAQAGNLDEDFKQALIDHKDAVIRWILQNQAAQSAQWQVFNHGEMYSKRISHNQELYIFREDTGNHFTVWRGSWRAGESKAFSEKTIVSGVSFDKAMERAKDYFNWATTPKAYNKRTKTN